MHIPDGVIGPGTAAATTVVGLGGLAWSLRRLRNESGERTVVLMGLVAACLFAAQMVNFPVGPGVSGHLLGGVLAAVLLGPWAGACVVGVVLTVQCLLFGDGGLTALGANFVNMGLIGSIGGYAIYAPIRTRIGGRRGVLIGAMLAAWFSVILSAGAFSIELAVTGRAADFPRILGWMTLVHAAIGLGESLITGVVLQRLLAVRPDMIYDSDGVAATAKPPALRKTVGAGLLIALCVALFLAPFASEWPDGLEFVGERLRFLTEAPPSLAAPFEEYRLPLPGLRHLRLATALAGAVGTAVVCVCGWGLARIFVGADKPERAADVV